jgi:hypothetical protein
MADLEEELRWCLKKDRANETDWDSHLEFVKKGYTSYGGIGKGI